MHRLRTTLLTGLILAAAAGSLAADRVPGDVIVAFDSTAPALRTNAPSGAPPLNAIDAVVGRHGLVSMQSLDAPATARLGVTAPTRLALLSFDSKADVDQIVAELEATPGVRFAEPNFVGGLSLTPSDPLFVQQADDFDKIGMRSAWDVQQGAKSWVRVAVIDSGVERFHPEIAPVLDLSNSYNFVDNNDEVFDDIGHGTMVAGIIGAQGYNGEGITGVAFGCTLVSYDVATPTGSISSAHLISALTAAKSAGCHVVNMSLEFQSYSQAMEETCDYLRESGITLVAAAGNGGQGELPIYPASFDSVIGVGAISDAGTRRAYYSNYNDIETSLVDLVAPGDTLFTTIPGSQYNGVLSTGTSFAAPLVAGTAALLVSYHGPLSPQTIERVLLDTTQPVPDFVPVGGAGAGLLDAKAALNATVEPDLAYVSHAIDDDSAIHSKNNDDGTLDPDEIVHLFITLDNALADADDVSGFLSTDDRDVEVHTPVADWGRIPSFTPTANRTPFVVELSREALAHKVSMRLELTGANLPAPVVILFDLQAERPVPVPGGGSPPPVLRADTTYEVMGDLTFNEGVTIEPGTIIKLAPGVNFLVKERNLLANGTATAPILITALVPGKTNRGGRVEISPGVSTASLQHVIIENCSGLVNQSTSTQIAHVTARGNAGPGIFSNAGTGAVDFCAALNNDNHGIRAGSRPIKNSRAEGNGGNGLMSVDITNSTASGNAGRGILGGTIIESTASDNLLEGILASGGIVNCRALRNGEAGLSATGGNIFTSQSIGNRKDGIILNGSGVLAGVLALGNGGTGIIVNNGTDIASSTSKANAGFGIEGNGANVVRDCLVIENLSQPFSQVREVRTSSVVRNGGPIRNVSTIDRSYVAESRNANIRGGEVVDSVVIGGLSTGILQPTNVDNTWVVNNGGIGIDDPSGLLSALTVIDNGSHGVRNIPAGKPMNGVNIHSNGEFDYYDDDNDAPPTGGSSKDLRHNYWGQETLAELQAQVPNITRVYDVQDSLLPNGYRAVLGNLGEFETAPIANAPDSNQTPAFLLRVSPDSSENVLVGRQLFTLVFSEPMDTNVEPSVTFALSPPYAENIVQPFPGWIDNRTWVGRFWITAARSLGTNTLRVADARSADGFDIPADTSHRFTVGDGQPSANNGVAVGTGSDFVQMGLSELQATLLPTDQGLNIRRARSNDLGEFQRINGPIVTQSSYTDNGLTANTTYYYIIDVVDEAGSSFQLTSPIEAKTAGVVPTPTPTPTPARVSSTFYVR